MKTDRRAFLKGVTAVVLSLCLWSGVPVYAADSEVETKNNMESVRTASTTRTFTDNENNRYAVLGMSTRSAYAANVTTSFSVSYYYGGTAADVARVNGYTKIVKASGQVSLLGGGSNSFGGTAYRTGGNGSYSKDASYIYWVSTLHGTHSVSCNGGSVSFSTYE